MDFATLTLGRKPNRFLMAPAGLCQQAQPHAESPVFKVPAAVLMQHLLDLVRSEDRVSITEVSENSLRAKFVARSRIFRFPDVIDVQILPLDDATSTLAVFARARYGVRDFGVNRARIEDWIARLRSRVG